MGTTIVVIERVHPERGVRIRILLNTRSFGRTDHDPGIDYVTAYDYRDLSQPEHATDAQILEYQFELFNNQIESAHAHAYSAAGNRSLSVGDVVSIEDRYYQCEASGWTRLDTTPRLESSTQR
ncbi:hypothetical protein [Nocardia sp. NPDC050710]|uniref:hypothetical protein n=1 Tax=Nocardia sp. NPDC050710 TaxID=3157220 RepID=UPI0033DB679E